MADIEKLTHRYIARFTVEAMTPLFVGSGKQSLLVDMLVQRDHLGLPMILGTSLAGVLRHNDEDKVGQAKPEDRKKLNSIFGHQDNNTKNGRGSRLHVSSAYLMIDKDQCSQGLEEVDTELQRIYGELPVRQHVRINERGVADDGGLFTNEVVLKGSRFRFEIELDGTVDDQEAWTNIVQFIESKQLRVGAGTRNGYGSLRVIESFKADYDLGNKDQRQAYLNLSHHLDGVTYSSFDASSKETTGATSYRLDLKPDDFFHFGTGTGDQDVDLVPLTEQVVTYTETGIETEEATVLPGSSIKGAIAHRKAYHYNRLKGQWADQLATSKTGRELQKKLLTGVGNEAVYQLFGAAAGQEKLGGEDRSGHRGHVMIDDIYLTNKEACNDKIFNHVAIDRFTGGAIDGALFSEKVSRLTKADGTITIEIQVEQHRKYNDDDHVIEAFEAALTDICSGLLPLGGLVTKGHGMFSGQLFKNGKEV